MVSTPAHDAGIIDRVFWRGRRVLVTGHTGFIGGWTAAWLHALGSKVAGIALSPPTNPSFHELVGLKSRMNESIADIRSPPALLSAFEAVRPEIVLHLAAQPLVRVGYEQPDETFAVNLMGTVNVLDCVRRHGAMAFVAMTSDKVYGPGDGSTHYREDDRLGAQDPYGSSKACCELAVEAYAQSYLANTGIGVATVRAGNVVGGGDWQIDRLVPDAMRAFAAGRPLVLRHPDAVRPWQHVLDAIQALLAVAQDAAHRRAFTGPWNVGPPPNRTVTVAALANLAASVWGADAKISHEAAKQYPETHFLAIDGSKARTELGIVSPWNLETIVERTVTWYKGALAGQDAWKLTMDQIGAYETDCSRCLTEALG